MNIQEILNNELNKVDKINIKTIEISIAEKQ